MFDNTYSETNSVPIRTLKFKQHLSGLEHGRVMNTDRSEKELWVFPRTILANLSQCQEFNFARM